MDKLYRYTVEHSSKQKKQEKKKPDITVAAGRLPKKNKPYYSLVERQPRNKKGQFKKRVL